MATFIISGSRGTDDPTMATLPFMAAKTAKEQGHDVVLWLWNESVTLGRKGTAEHVTGVNLTPLKDLLAAVRLAWGCRLYGGQRRLWFVSRLVILGHTSDQHPHAGACRVFECCSGDGYLPLRSVAPATVILAGRASRPVAESENP